MFYKNYYDFLLFVIAEGDYDTFAELDYESPYLHP